VTATTRSDDLSLALARWGFARPTEVVRHLAACALDGEALRRVATACAVAPDPDLAVAQICRLIAITGRVPSSGFLARLAAVLGLSTSLGSFLNRHPEHMDVLRDARSLAKPRSRKGLADQALRALRASDDPGSALRIFKRRELLRIACRDLAGGASVEEVGRELSYLAEAALRAALVSLEDEFPAPEGARFCVIGMGKLGSTELNYSSDIDVMFVFDSPQEAVGAEWAIKIGEGVLARLASTTDEGQAFRVDASLRPEGKSGPLVRSLAAYRAYYERWAKPWEFQALIKARPVAGNATLGEEFVELVRPFVYPERLSPEAIREIRAMKARAERVIASRGLAGREVKRGPGGIRDIEFAVQLLQLVHARRDASLRSGNTLEALSALAHGAYVGDDDAADLAGAYRFLRRIEHRLQLAQERQTHTVPEDESRRRTLARAMGFRDAATQTVTEVFEEEWRRTQTLVRRIHEKLFYRPLLERFAQAPALNPDAAQERLGALGFRSPGRSLKFLGDLTSGLSRRAQLMRTLLPVMLDWMADAPDPDLAVSSFRDVALRVGGNTSALAALRDSPPVVELLCRVLGTSRLLGEYVLHVPEMVPALADPRTLSRKTREQLLAEACETIEWRGDPAERDAAIRRLKRRELLRVACRDLAGGVSVEEVGRELTYLAEGALRAALMSLEEELPAPAGARFCVIGMGKLGGEELNYSSDIDVMFVFDSRQERVGLDWATRMGEGVLSRLAATTEEGQAFRVDASLRPEGKDGPLVRSLASFRAYYRRWAKPWEFQALIKARPVAGDQSLGEEFVELVRPLVYPEQLPPETIRGIRAMKARIERERLKPGEDPRFQLKVGTGGLVDVEFTIQLLQLMHGYRDRRLQAQGTIPAIAAAADLALIDLQKGRWLIDAFRLLNRTRNLLYLVRGRPQDSLPREAEDLEIFARALGYLAPGARVRFLEDYRRATRRARQVCEDVFYGGEG